MIYQFKCNECNLEFEVKQPMREEHIAKCPKCNKYARRIYFPLIHFWPDVLWNKDGSRQSPDDLPPVPTGTKYTYGWSPKEE